VLRAARIVRRIRSVTSQCSVQQTEARASARKVRGAAYACCIARMTKALGMAQLCSGLVAGHYHPEGKAGEVCYALHR